MKKYLIFVLAACLSAGVFGARGVFSAEEGTLAVVKPAAVIIKATGGVTVKQNGENVEIKGRIPLMTGDKLIVPEGSYALLLYGNGKRVEVTSDYEVEKIEDVVEGKEISAAESAARILINSTPGSKTDEVLRSKLEEALEGSGEKFVFISTFVNTNTANRKPVFTWYTEEAEEKSTAVLKDSGGAELWILETKGKSAAYPDDLIPLPAGAEYKIEVTSEFVGGGTSTASGTFYVLSEKENEETEKAVESIKKAHSGEGNVEIQSLLLAQYYKSKKLYMDAIDELKKLIVINQNDLDSRRELIEIYLLTGNADYAARELEAMENLTAEKPQ